jgi:hypothetical protein
MDKVRPKCSLISGGDDLHHVVTDLVWRNNVTSALPAALYWCTIGRAQEILEGKQCDSRLVRLEDPELRVRVAIAKENMSRAWSATAFASWVRGEHTDSTCYDRKGVKRLNCEHGQYAIYKAMWGATSTHGSLDSWKPDWESQLCNSCTQIAKSKYLQGRSEIWAKLPTMFGLDGWEVLLRVERTCTN